MTQIEIDALNTLIVELPRIADALEKIAKNTEPVSK